MSTNDPQYPTPAEIHSSTLLRLSNAMVRPYMVQFGRGPGRAAVVAEFCEAVEAVTSRKVRAFHSSVDTEADGQAVEVSSCTPQATTGRREPKAQRSSRHLPTRGTRAPLSPAYAPLLREFKRSKTAVQRAGLRVEPAPEVMRRGRPVARVDNRKVLDTEPHVDRR
jgi:hypothetical protein